MPKRPGILIAEDDENDRFLIQRAFDKAGKKVAITFAKDGEETIEILKQTPAKPATQSYTKLLLLDIKMPRRGGFQVLQWLIENPARRPTFVIVLTSSCDPRDIERARALRADSYIVKPMDHSEYVKIAEELTSQSTSPVNLGRALSRYHRSNPPPATPSWQ
jgi:CheY-like chemotaxis protein